MYLIFQRINMVQIEPKEIDEPTITKTIIRKASEDWLNYSECDVIVVGSGPSGLTASIYLAIAFASIIILHSYQHGLS